MCGVTNVKVQFDRAPMNDGEIAIDGFMMLLMKSIVNILGWAWRAASRSQSKAIPQSIVRLIPAIVSGEVAPVASLLA
jgi:hypothetical protein